MTKFVTLKTYNIEDKRYIKISKYDIEGLQLNEIKKGFYDDSNGCFYITYDDHYEYLDNELSKNGMTLITFEELFNNNYRNLTQKNVMDSNYY